jgi:hypothetical protein
VTRKKSEKPALALVGSAPAIGVQPPFTLGKAGRSLWDRIQGEYDVSDAGGIEMLAQICAAADLAEQLQQEIEADGAVVRSHGTVRSHPAVKDLIAARSFITRGLIKLGLNFEPVRASGGRPGGFAGYGGEP